MMTYPERDVLRPLSKELFDLVLNNSSPVQWSEWLRTPLEHAAAQGNADFVTKLLSAKAKVMPGSTRCERAGNGVTEVANNSALLDAAIRGGCTKVLSALLAAGAKADLNLVSGPMKWTALHRAIHLKHLDVARTLLLAGSEADVVDANHLTPLLLAVHYRFTQLVLYLLFSGARIDAKDERGNNPLHVAARYGHDEIAGALLDKGAKKDTLNNRGCTALNLAAEHGHVATVQLLMDDARYEALHLAVRGGHVEIVKLLLERRIDVNADVLSKSVVCTVLHNAAASGHEDVIAILVEAGANVEAVDKPS